MLTETVADRASMPNKRKTSEDGSLSYSDWIGHLKEIMHVCGVEAPVPHMPTLPLSSDPSSEVYCQDRGGKVGSPPKMTSIGTGITSQRCGPSRPSLSVFSRERMRNGRRHSAAATPQVNQCASNVTTGQVKFEADEDREVLSYLVRINHADYNIL